MKPGENFHRDDIFGKHKDFLLDEHWSKNSYKGIYVIPNSYELQKTLGIDIILQDPVDPSKEIKIDAKHNPGFTGNFFLEELSCSNPGRETKGWILKETGHPDFIAYCFWLECPKSNETPCKIRNENTNSCFDCEREYLTGRVFHLPFQQLREWFIKNKDNKNLCRPFTLNWTSNHTSGRIVSINVLAREIEVIEAGEYKINLQTKMAENNEEKQGLQTELSEIKNMLQLILNKENDSEFYMKQAGDLYLVKGRKIA
jgi:hypothetical protein